MKQNTIYEGKAGFLLSVTMIVAEPTIERLMDIYKQDTLEDVEFKTFAEKQLRIAKEIVDYINNNKEVFGDLFLAEGLFEALDYEHIPTSLNHDETQPFEGVLNLYVLNNLESFSLEVQEYYKDGVNKELLSEFTEFICNLISCEVTKKTCSYEIEDISIS